MSRPISVPTTIVSKRSSGQNVIYKRHEELGRGGFAAVYRVTNQSTCEDFALKAISRERVSKPKSMEKIKSEISIQKSLNHPNILRSYDSFSDSLNYYIIIELCPGHSVKDMIKKQGKLSETETSRIIGDVLNGLCYLHDNRIIHRDLKPENFLVGSDGKIKIADFGLSAKLDYDDERKFTVCGTPNYLSPELLLAASKGHTYAVDIWTIGVCAFTMLTGHPPFETRGTKQTYEHIKAGQYRFPSSVNLSFEAVDFIKTILQINPELRPNAQELMRHPFISGNHIPKQPYVKPIRKAYKLPEPQPVQIKRTRHIDPIRHREDPLLGQRNYAPKVAAEPVYRRPNENVLNPDEKPKLPETKAMPHYCVARFCDHSAKHGLGYLLIDGTVGACFNDLSRMIMDPHETFVQYYENQSTIIPEVMSPHSPIESKKLSILRKFSDLLKKTKSMYTLPIEHYRDTIPLHHVKYWSRNDDATLFRLEDKIVQVNFNDRTKIVYFPEFKKMIMVTSIKETGKMIPVEELSSSNKHCKLIEEQKRFTVAKDMLAEMNGR